ncbi:hypothetical protein ES708_11266 [subsurface metagenome]
MASPHCGTPQKDPPIYRKRVRRNWGIEDAQLRGRKVAYSGGGSIYSHNFLSEREALEEFESLKGI